MKRWAALTVALYVVCISVLSAPVFVFLLSSSRRAADDELHASLVIFFAVIVPVLVLAQAALLLVPVARSQERPVGKRRLSIAAIVVAFLMVVMVFSFLWSLSLLIWGERDFPDGVAWTSLGLVPLMWLIWAIVFYENGVGANARSFTSTVTKWLLGGSILEVLVAIPSHIVSRHREECCAPMFTLIGIATGLSVALMAFGPGVFFLFVNRIRGKRPRQQAPKAESEASTPGEGDAREAE